MARINEHYRNLAAGYLFPEIGRRVRAFAAAHPGLPLIALEFERGGDGVFVTTAAEIRDFLRNG